ncbi:MAG: hypothetical protein JWP25_1988 [Bradyrhizobium sp.]|nr:hypothetical protein [Bradyrhizobium sp.]
MQNISDFASQHNVARSLLPALLIPETGTSLHTLLAPGAVKTLACIDMRPGDGLNRKARRVAVKAHDICQARVHADIPGLDGQLPTPADFHAPTLLWAIETSVQIGLWTETGTSLQDDVSAWLVNAAYAGSRFQTLINATPAHAAAWLAHVHRWKGSGADIRVFGPEGGR